MKRKWKVVDSEVSVPTTTVTPTTVPSTLVFSPICTLPSRYLLKGLCRSQGEDRKLCPLCAQMKKDCRRHIRTQHGLTLKQADDVWNTVLLNARVTACAVLDIGKLTPPNSEDSHRSILEMVQLIKDIGVPLLNANLLKEWSDRVCSRNSINTTSSAEIPVSSLCDVDPCIESVINCGKQHTTVSAGSDDFVCRKTRNDTDPETTVSVSTNNTSSNEVCTRSATCYTVPATSPASSQTTVTNRTYAKVCTRTEVNKKPETTVSVNTYDQLEPSTSRRDNIPMSGNEEDIWTLMMQPPADSFLQTPTVSFLNAEMDDEVMLPNNYFYEGQSMKHDWQRRLHEKWGLMKTLGRDQQPFFRQWISHRERTKQGATNYSNISLAERFCVAVLRARQRIGEMVTPDDIIFGITIYRDYVDKLQRFGVGLTTRMWLAVQLKSALEFIENRTEIVHERRRSALARWKNVLREEVTAAKKLQNKRTAQRKATVQDSNVEGYGFLMCAVYNDGVDATLQKVEQLEEVTRQGYNTALSVIVASLLVPNGCRGEMIYKLLNRNVLNLLRTNGLVIDPIQEYDGIKILSVENPKSNANGNSLVSYICMDDKMFQRFQCFRRIMTRVHGSERERYGEKPFFIQFNGKSLSSQDTSNVYKKFWVECGLEGISEINTMRHLVANEGIRNAVDRITKCVHEEASKRVQLSNHNGSTELTHYCDNKSRLAVEAYKIHKDYGFREMKEKSVEVEIQTRMNGNSCLLFPPLSFPHLDDIDLFDESIDVSHPMDVTNDETFSTQHLLPFVDSRFAGEPFDFDAYERKTLIGRDTVLSTSFSQFDYLQYPVAIDQSNVTDTHSNVAEDVPGIGSVDVEGTVLSSPEEPQLSSLLSPYSNKIQERSLTPDGDIPCEGSVRRELIKEEEEEINNEWEKLYGEKVPLDTSKYIPKEAHDVLEMAEQLKRAGRIAMHHTQQPIERFGFWKTIDGTNLNQFLKARRAIPCQEFLGIEVRPCSTGFGLFANRKIPKDVLLFDYRGYRRSTVEHEADMTHLTEAEVNFVHCYLFEIQDGFIQSHQPAKDNSIMLGRYCNHSPHAHCTNVFPKAICLNTNNGGDTIVFVSKRVIQKHEELTWCYGRFFKDEEWYNNCTVCGTTQKPIVPSLEDAMPSQLTQTFDLPPDSQVPRVPIITVFEKIFPVSNWWTVCRNEAYSNIAEALSDSIGTPMDLTTYATVDETLSNYLLQYPHEALAVVKRERRRETGDAILYTGRMWTSEDTVTSFVEVVGSMFYSYKPNGLYSTQKCSDETTKLLQKSFPFDFRLDFRLQRC